MKDRDSRKKILFMLTSMNIGGVEKSLISLLETFPQNKYDITVLLLEKKGGFLKYIPRWVKVKEAEWYPKLKPILKQPPQETVKNYLNIKEFYKVPSFIISYLASKRFDNRYIYYKEVMREVPMCKESYDVAIAYQGPTDIIDFYVAKKVKAKKKLSWIHFDVSKHEINKKLYEKIQQDFNKTFVVSDEARERFIEKLPKSRDKTEKISNIISHKLIRRMSQDPVEFDEEFQGLKIVTVGRLSKEKGQDIAIKVLKELRENNYDVKWYCIGEGNDRSFYEGLIKQYNLEKEFILLGAKLNPYPYVLKADLYVQPSRHEGFCMTLAEAKCLKKPIITTNFAGAQEQIDNELNGIIVNDIKGLYFNLVKLIEKKELRECLSKNLIFSENSSSGIPKKIVD